MHGVEWILHGVSNVTSAHFVSVQNAKEKKINNTGTSAPAWFLMGDMLLSAVKLFLPAFRTETHTQAPLQLLVADGRWTEEIRATPRRGLLWERMRLTTFSSCLQSGYRRWWGPGACVAEDRKSPQMMSWLEASHFFKSHPALVREC